MGKPGKILTVLIAISAMIVVSLVVAVKLYLTDARIKTLVISPLEKSLGRTVHLDTIKVGLFSGITINGVTIKERNGRQDFVTAKAFVLRYHLLPLLRRQVVISEVRLEQPVIRIHRDQSGTFNFSSLAVLSRPQPGGKNAQPGSAAPLPVALTVKTIAIDQAKLLFTDARGQLPAADTVLDGRLSLDLNRQLTTVRYQGRATFSSDLRYGGLTPHLQGSAAFSAGQLTLNLDLELEGEKLHLLGQANDLATTPRIQLDLNARSLNLDHFQAMLAKLPKSKSAPRPPARQAANQGKQAIGRALPKGLDLHGTLQVEHLRYRQLTASNLHLRYQLKDGVLAVKKATVQTAGGTITAAFQADVRHLQPPIKGSLAVKTLQIQEMLKGVAPQLTGLAAGDLDGACDFTGRGLDWPHLRPTLTADGTFAVDGGRLANTALTRTVAALVGLQELADLQLDHARGSFRIRDGRLLLDSQLSGQKLSILAKGAIGLDGRLDLPVTLRLGSDLSARLRQRVALSRYLADQHGETVLQLRIRGTIHDPRPALNPVAARQQVEQAVKKKVIEELDKAISGGKPPVGQESQPSPAQQLLRGILGQ